MNDVGLPFWVERGTLLGLVRDGSIIPWDHDYDFGTWRDAATQEKIRRAFGTGEYRVQPLAQRGIDGVHVLPRDGRGSGMVDIVIYEQRGELAVHRSRCIRTRPWTPFALGLQRFVDPELEADQWTKRWIERAFHGGIVRHMPMGVGERLVRELHGLLDRCHERVDLSYEFPAELFRELRTVSFLGVPVPVPAQAERYLALAYGEDWRTPRRWRHWSEGATHVQGKRRDAAFRGS